MEFMNQFNDEQAQANFDPADVQKNKSLAIIAYFWILFFLPYVAAKDSAFAKFHANQAFNFLVASLVISVVSGIITIIPILGPLVAIVLRLPVFAAMIILMICASKGMAVRIPVIGNLEIFK